MKKSMKGPELTGLLLIVLGVSLLGMGLAEAAGNTCKSGVTTDHNSDPNGTGPWKAPTKAEDSTPLNCGGSCPNRTNCTKTCKETATFAYPIGNPPAGAAEYGCFCVYTCTVNGVTSIITHVDPTCDKRVQKNAAGEPIPWNDVPSNSDFKCAGTCTSGICTEVLDELEWDDEEQRWDRQTDCLCQ